MRLTIIIMLFVCSITSLVSEEVKEEKLSQSVKKAEAVFFKDLTDAKAKYDEALIKASKKYKKTLDYELKKAMRKGDLDLAKAIDKRKNLADIACDVTTESLGLRIDSKKVDKKAETIKNIQNDNTKKITTMIGKWNVNQRLYEFDKNGIVTCGNVKGKWSLKNKQINIVWDSGHAGHWSIKENGKIYTQQGIEAKKL